MLLFKCLLRNGRVDPLPAIVPALQASKGKEAGAPVSSAHDITSPPLQARLADERTQRIQAEHDAAEEARHAARLAAQRESSQGVQLALGRQVQPMRICVYILLYQQGLNKYVRMHTDIMCDADICEV